MVDVKQFHNKIEILNRVTVRKLLQFIAFQQKSFTKYKNISSNLKL